MSHEPADAAEKCDFLKSMDTEWQTLLENQAAKVLSSEETARARERRLDEIVRWILAGLVLGSQTTTWHLDVGPSHDSS